MGENVRVRNYETESNGRRYLDTLSDFVATMRSLRVEMQSSRADNEKLVKAQEDQNQLNAAMLQILTKLQINMDSGHGTVNLEGSKSSTRRRKMTSSGSSESEESSGGSISSSHRSKRKRRHRNNTRDGFKKEKPPTFNGEVNSSQEDESWLLGMRKYFQV